MIIGFILLHQTSGQGELPNHLSLDQFPLTVGNWEGVSVPLSEDAKQILNANGYASVLFRKEGNGSPILFFSAFYDHQTAEQNIHSPLNCLPGSGWNILHTKVISLPLYGPGRKSFPVNVDVIQKGIGKQLVIYWYQERGRIFPGEYEGRYFLVRDGLILHRTDGALVRISMSIKHSEKDSLDNEIHFIQGLMPILSKYIPGNPLEGSMEFKATGSKSNGVAYVLR